MMAGDLAGLAGLFGAAFLAATVLPTQSEAVLAAMTIGSSIPVLALLAVASTGNVLGACLNWWLGGQLDRFRGRRWFPVSDAGLARARAGYASWGWPSLLLSWVPIIGDPLTLAAGILKEPLWRFVIVVGIAKTGRYAAVIALADRFVG